jgi:CRP-like cAMP-binding protein
MIQTHPRIAEQLLQLLARRLKRTNDDLSSAFGDPLCVICHPHRQAGWLRVGFHLLTVIERIAAVLVPSRATSCLRCPEVIVSADAQKGRVAAQSHYSRGTAGHRDRGTSSLCGEYSSIRCPTNWWLV